MTNTNINTFDPTLFAQFMQFMAMNEQMKKDKEATKKFHPQRSEKGTVGVTRLSGKRRRPFMASITSEPDPLYGNKIL